MSKLNTYLDRVDPLRDLSIHLFKRRGLKDVLKFEYYYYYYFCRYKKEMNWRNYLIQPEEAGAYEQL